jgi:pimeloyl-ACP methyl ester carboxylesterase
MCPRVFPIRIQTGRDDVGVSAYDSPPSPVRQEGIRVRNIIGNCTRVCCVVALALLLMHGANRPALAQSGDDPDETAELTDDLPPMPKHGKNSAWDKMMKTMGGRQFWGDVKFFRGWRIQQNVFTEHYRLLDPRDSRYAFGSYKTCCDKLEEMKVKQKLPPMSGKAVIEIHGITKSSKTFNAMYPALEKAGYMPVPFDYPSTRIDIAQAAGYLDRVIQSLRGVEEIDFVVHSMGGLVVRSWFQNHDDLRVRRLVMLGTPNRGAEMADMLRRNAAYRLIMGPAGQQLVTGNNSPIAGLPIPPCEFAVIAGGRGSDGYNPLVPGDNDLIVSVESTRLAGASDFLMVRAMHHFLTSNPEAIDATVRYLQTGHFRKNGVRKPIMPTANEERTADLRTK